MAAGSNILTSGVVLTHRWDLFPLWFESLFAFLQVPTYPHHPRLCKPHVACEVCIKLLAYSVLIRSSLPCFNPPPPSHYPSLTLVHKAISLIDDWAALSDLGERHAWDLMKKRVMLHYGGRSKELGNVWSPPQSTIDAGTTLPWPRFGH